MCAYETRTKNQALRIEYKLFCLIEPSTMGVRPHAERVPNLIEAPRPMAISCLTMTIKPRIFTQICISRYHKFSFHKNRYF